MLNITVMLKKGGYDVVKIPPTLLGRLAETIQTKGFEYVVLKSRAIEVVGFMVTGKQTGDRVIILGDKQKATEEAKKYLDGK